jgi:hypothetical protein
VLSPRSAAWKKFARKTAKTLLSAYHNFPRVPPGHADSGHGHRSAPLVALQSGDFFDFLESECRKEATGKLCEL